VVRPENAGRPLSLRFESTYRRCSANAPSPRGARQFLKVLIPKATGADPLMAEHSGHFGQCDPEAEQHGQHGHERYEQGNPVLPRLVGQAPAFWVNFIFLAARNRRHPVLVKFRYFDWSARDGVDRHDRRFERAGERRMTLKRAGVRFSLGERRAPARVHIGIWHARVRGGGACRNLARSYGGHSFGGRWQRAFIGGWPDCTLRGEECSRA
jgi:hypothetical protein